MGAIAVAQLYLRSEWGGDVLRLVAASLANNPITERLIVTGGASRRRRNNSVGKLGASSRTQTLGRELDLLEPHG